MISKARLKGGSTSGGSYETTDEDDTSSSTTTTTSYTPTKTTSTTNYTTTSTSGSTSSTTSNDEPDDTTAEVTTTMNDTIDLGHSPAAGGSTKYDFENHAGATVDTSSEIQDAGGPQTVLVGSQDDANEITSVIGEVTGQIRDAQESQQNQQNDPAMNLPDAASVPDTVTQYVPVPDGGGMDTAKVLAVAAVAFVVAVILG